MSSPVNFNPLGALKNVAKGFINRKDYGGGLGGVVKATGAQITGEHEDNKLDSINEKLDTLVSSMGGEEDSTPNPAQDPALSPPAPVTPATPLNFKEFMTTPQQNPFTNGTGGGGAVFKNTTAMDVSQNPNTKGSLFNKQ
jgi:hypothetical protein